MKAKKIIIIAGPNGAGKTTFGREYLPNEADCPIFVNADLIAAGLSPFRPADAAIRAGRLMFEYNNSGMMPTQKELKNEKGVTPVLIRAAKRAHLIAHQTGTKVVVMRDGKVVEIDPDPEMYNDI